MNENSGDGGSDTLGENLFSGTVTHIEDDTITAGENEEENRDNEPLREQDRFLPIANVARIMKKSIPKNGKIAKDAKECVQECVSEFISFITSESSERCHQEKRKTINGEDILFAMSTLGFDSYVEPLKLYLQKYREASKGDKSLQQVPEESQRLDDLGADDTFGHNLPANILTTEQQTQQNVIYTYASQYIDTTSCPKRTFWDSVCLDSVLFWYKEDHTLN